MMSGTVTSSPNCASISLVVILAAGLGIKSYRATTVSFLGCSGTVCCVFGEFDPLNSFAQEQDAMKLP